MTKAQMQKYVDDLNKQNQEVAERQIASNTRYIENARNEIKQTVTRLVADIAAWQKANAATAATKVTVEDVFGADAVAAAS